jgi:preprotein translocase subunit YajC
MHRLFFAFSNNPQGGGQGGPSLLVSFIPILLIFVIFYLLLILPQQKKQKQHINMINSLKKGDQIVTSSGMFGTIADVKEQKIVLKIADEVKIEIVKSAVATVVDRKDM